MVKKLLKREKTSLADKINNLIIVEPTNFGSDDEDEEAQARVVDKYDDASSNNDVGFSLLRKQNVSLLEDVDERYKGKKISRKDIYEDDESDPFQSDNDRDSNKEMESNYESMEEDSIEKSEVDDSDENNDEATDEDNDQSNSQEDYSDDSIDSQQADKDDDKNFKNIIPSNEGEIEKGQCIHHQLKIWENLLEMRIKLQKCLIVSNKLPQYNIHNDFMSDKECLKRKNETEKSLAQLLDNMLNIQNKLLSNYPETKGKFSMKKTNIEKENNDDDDPMNEEIDSDTDEEKCEEEIENDNDEPPKKKQKVKKKLSEYEKIIDENHKKYSSYRNSVIQKWNDKTRIASGKMNKSVNQSVVKQIEFLLNDKSKILQKTQLKRSEYEIIGKVQNETKEDGRRIQEYDPEIYDDDDFYHQLLRELIEQKAADITDPIQLSKQWIQLQNMRTKMKRKIDTRATKGRRIRYNVHPKLVNFMAPITINDTWSDEAKTELYNSLFGKIKVVENS